MAATEEVQALIGLWRRRRERAKRTFERRLCRLVAAEGNRLFGRGHWTFANVNLDLRTGTIEHFTAEPRDATKRAAGDFCTRLRALLDETAARPIEVLWGMAWNYVEVLFLCAVPGDADSYTGHAVYLWNPNPDE